MITGTTQTTPYVPTASTVWKIANISLATYTTYPNVQLKIVNVTDGGNNLYIDNINLGALITSIDEANTQINDVLVYPNPANGSFLIEYALTNNDNVTIEITDILGREVYKTLNKTQIIGTNKQEINTSLVNGVYNITIKTSNSIINKKVIVNK